MLQASYTRLLNSNNFAVIGDNDRVYNTTPEGLTELTAATLAASPGPSLADYVGVANYCKSLVLNPAITSFNLQVDDIMRIWETRLLCMLLVAVQARKNLTGSAGAGLVSDKMLQFEASNVLDQIVHLNSTAAAAASTSATGSPATASQRTRKQIKLDRQFANVLMWMKHGGRDVALLDHYYKEAFRARTSAQHDQEYLSRLQFAVLAVLLRRKELFTAYTVVSMENDHTAETTSLVRDRIEANAQDTDLLCFGLSLAVQDDRPGQPVSVSTAALYGLLVRALGART